MAMLVMMAQARCLPYQAALGTTIASSRRLDLGPLPSKGYCRSFCRWSMEPSEVDNLAQALHPVLGIG